MLTINNCCRDEQVKLVRGGESLLKLVLLNCLPLTKWILKLLNTISINWRSIMSTQILNATLNVVLPGVDNQTNVANVFEKYVLCSYWWKRYNNTQYSWLITHVILIKQLITIGNLKFRLATVSREESAESRGSYSNFSGCCTITKLATNPLYPFLSQAQE